MEIARARGLSDQELDTEIANARRHLYDLRFQLATRQLTDHSQLTQTRRSIARVLTVMTERSLDETLVPRTPSPKPATRAAAAKTAAKKEGAAKSAPAKKVATKSTTAADTADDAAKGDEE